nr:hypothetical protein [Nesterenkonia sp. F]
MRGIGGHHSARDVLAVAGHGAATQTPGEGNMLGEVCEGPAVRPTIAGAATTSGHLQPGGEEGLVAGAVVEPALSVVGAQRADESFLAGERRRPGAQRDRQRDQVLHTVVLDLEEVDLQHQARVGLPLGGHEPLPADAAQAPPTGARREPFPPGQPGLDHVEEAGELLTAHWRHRRLLHREPSFAVGEASCSPAGPFRPHGPTA